MKYKLLIIGIVIGAILGSIATQLFTKKNASTEHFVLREVVGTVDGELFRAVKMNTQTGDTWGLTKSGWKQIHN